MDLAVRQSHAHGLSHSVVPIDYDDGHTLNCPIQCAAIYWALQCKGKNMQISVYGFNWAATGWQGHAWEAEKNIVSALEDSLGSDFQVHRTSCGATRFCNQFVNATYADTCKFVERHADGVG